MALVFLGDITYPFKGAIRLHECEVFFQDKVSIGNLEGALAPTGLTVKDEYAFSLYNDSSLLQLAQQMNLKGLSLANNHTADFIGGTERTLRLLGQQESIQYFGLQSQSTCVLLIDGITYVVLGVCSPLTGAVGGGEVPLEMLEGQASIGRIEALRKKFPDAVIVVYVHWGYELARFPQPADREWAKRVIRSGGNAVIGHHPHVVQGVEYFEGGVIAYSLGNWLLFQGQYLNKRLSYHQDADTETQMALELHVEKESLRAIVHLFQYSKEPHRIKHVSTEELDVCQMIKKLTPYVGSSDDEYKKFFYSLREGMGTPKGYPTLWSYSHLGGLSVRVKYLLIKVRKILRKGAIKVGLHRPYNWG